VGTRGLLSLPACGALVPRGEARAPGGVGAFVGLCVRAPACLRACFASMYLRLFLSLSVGGSGSGDVGGSAGAVHGRARQVVRSVYVMWCGVSYTDPAPSHPVNSNLHLLTRLAGRLGT
jgi:hypothetical protein